MGKYKTENDKIIFSEKKSFLIIDYKKCMIITSIKKNKKFKIEKIRKTKLMISQTQIFEIKPLNPRRIKLINEFKHKTQTKINKTNYNEIKTYVLYDILSEEGLGITGNLLQQYVLIFNNHSFVLLTSRFSYRVWP